MIGMMAMMVMAQPQVNEAISGLVSPIIEPINKHLLPQLTEPLGEVTDSLGEVAGELWSVTPFGALCGALSLAFSKPEPLWEPNEETQAQIDEATQERISLVMEWQLFGETAIQPWHGQTAFEVLEAQLYAPMAPTQALPEPVYSDAHYALDALDASDDAVREARIHAHAKALIQAYAESEPTPGDTA